MPNLISVDFDFSFVMHSYSNFAERSESFVISRKESCKKMILNAKAILVTVLIFKTLLLIAYINQYDQWIVSFSTKFTIEFSDIFFSSQRMLLHSIWRSRVQYPFCVETFALRGLHWSGFSSFTIAHSEREISNALRSYESLVRSSSISWQNVLCYVL